MSLIGRLFGRRSSLENPSTPLSAPAAWLWGALGAHGSATGMVVSPQSAIRLSVVMTCVKVIAETVGTLPVSITEPVPGAAAGRRSVTSGPAWDLLQSRPNAWTSWPVFWEAFMASALLHGHGAAQIERNGGGDPVALHFIPPWAIDREQAIDGLGMRYRVTLAGGQLRYLDEADVLWVPGISVDGVKPLHPVREIGVEVIGLGLAAQAFGSKFFGNSARPGAVLEVPGRMDPEAANKLAGEVARQYAGAENAFRTMVLEEGAKLHTVQLSPEEGQFIETRKQVRSEVAGMFRIPPHLVGDLEKATFSNIATQDRAFAQHTVSPWTGKLAAEMDEKLLPTASPACFGFSLDTYLRGDFKTRMESYHLALNDGILTINEVREMEGRPPVEGGDVPRVQVNTAPLAIAGPEDEGQGPDGAPADNEGDEIDV